MGGRGPGTRQDWPRETRGATPPNAARQELRNHPAEALGPVHKDGHESQDSSRSDLHQHLDDMRAVREQLPDLQEVSPEKVDGVLVNMFEDDGPFPEVAPSAWTTAKQPRGSIITVSATSYLEKRSRKAEDEAMGPSAGGPGGIGTEPDVKPLGGTHDDALCERAL